MSRVREARSLARRYAVAVLSVDVEDEHLVPGVADSRLAEAVRVELAKLIRTINAPETRAARTRQINKAARASGSGSQ